MADTKISGLPASTTPLAGTEVLPIVQGTTTKQVSIANVTAGRAVSALSLTSTNDASISGLTVGKGGGAISTNTSVGVSALGANTTGSNNIAIGNTALSSMQTGVQNIALGNNAMFNATGSENVAVGYNALNGLTSGGTNVAVGNSSLLRTTSASNNTGFGYHAVRFFTGGSNTGVGYKTLNGVDGSSTGTNNTALGYQAGTALTTGSNNTIIGYNAAASAATVSNEITLGNSSVATLRCQVTSITALSDSRDKANIQPIAAGLDFVNQLKPVSFDWNMRDGGKVGIPDTGFIAQDLKQVQIDTGIEIPGLVYESNPESMEAAYGKLLPVLVKALQELNTKFNEYVAAHP